ncbi:PH domain-containing protein, partial [Escherichia coli]|nr:PH domain-containing protein [Escherichia coli]
IPRGRIQDVSIERGPFARIFGLAVVRLETGGGEAEEAMLDSVSMAEAERLRALLRGRRVAPEIRAGAETPVEPDRHLVFAMSLGRVLLSGAFGFSMIWIAAIYGAIHSLDRVLQFDCEKLFGEAERIAFARFSILGLFLVLAMALLLCVIAGVVRTLLKDYGFVLTHEPG